MSIEQRAKEREAEICKWAKAYGMEIAMAIRRAYHQGYTDGKADQWEQSRFKEEGE